MNIFKRKPKPVIVIRLMDANPGDKQMEEMAKNCRNSLPGYNTLLVTSNVEVTIHNAEYEI